MFRYIHPLITKCVSGFGVFFFEKPRSIQPKRFTQRCTQNTQLFNYSVAGKTKKVHSKYICDVSEWASLTLLHQGNTVIAVDQAVRISGENWKTVVYEYQWRQGLTVVPEKRVWRSADKRGGSLNTRDDQTSPGPHWGSACCSQPPGGISRRRCRPQLSNNLLWQGINTHKALKTCVCGLVSECISVCLNVCTCVL